MDEEFKLIYSYSDGDSNIKSILIENQLLYLYNKYSKENQTLVKLKNNIQEFGRRYIQPLVILKSFKEYLNDSPYESFNQSILSIYNNLIVGVLKNDGFQVGDIKETLDTLLQSLVIPDQIKSVNQQKIFNDEEYHRLMNLSILFRDGVRGLLEILVSVVDSLDSRRMVFINDHLLKIFQVILQYHIPVESEQQISDQIHWSNRDISNCSLKLLDVYQKIQKRQNSAFIYTLLDVYKWKSKELDTYFKSLQSTQDAMWKYDAITIYSFFNFIKFVYISNLTEFIGEFKKMIQIVIANLIDCSQREISHVGIEILDYLITNVPNDHVIRSTFNHYQIYQKLFNSIKIDESDISSQNGISLLFRLLYKLYPLNSNSIIHPGVLVPPITQSNTTNIMDILHQPPTPQSSTDPLVEYQNILQLFIKIINDKSSSVTRKLQFLSESKELFTHMTVYLIQHLSLVLKGLLNLIEHSINDRKLILSSLSSLLVLVNQCNPRISVHSSIILSALIPLYNYYSENTTQFNQYIIEITKSLYQSIQQYNNTILLPSSKPPIDIQQILNQLNTQNSIEILSFINHK
ncbi:hypothetical protein DLAC_07620 [Tieghemostelium lacteum]|uniref:Armadillo-like helical domain-containing protein n=1 Tax=Tieghemostelium lacteum TaxID=361077 RepID=A0A151ZCY9_TIELA|nr:hypothetical protein DLAC_07620 [Tieghemostelium lacteum]|eukprot:KYQ91822.1 hypothetical protein DLAC_07620 [Tieghemostelium lacteum]